MSPAAGQTDALAQDPAAHRSDDGRLRAGVIQMTPGPDKAANLDKAEELIAAAAADGAQLLVLQEAFSYRGPHTPEDMERVSEPVPGPTSHWLSEQARKHGIWLHGGSIFERNEADLAHAFNCSLVCNPQGELVGKYRKIHLFALHHGQSLSEADYQCPGTAEQVVTVATPWGGLGLSICFDLRFPDLYQQQVRQQGARMLTVPSAFLFRTGADHWEILLRARAIETQCYVLAPNCLSEGGHGPQTYGRSMIIDPWGAVLACMPDREGYVLADLDFSLQDKVRRKLPVLGSSV
jgi:predicted amidohydrolase